MRIFVTQPDSENDLFHLAQRTGHGAVNTDGSAAGAPSSAGSVPPSHTQLSQTVQIQGCLRMPVVLISAR